MNGSDEIKRHKWFKGKNWRKLDARDIQPNFKPNVSGKDCTANFDERWTAMPPQDSPALTPKDGAHFQDYTVPCVLVKFDCYVEKSSQGDDNLACST